ncbi:hypothetical protein EVJ58_g7334 [Rhodofomes roseus]|uniref:Pheromone n=1 Tax=Rhodofomes roseus TaxID=34475 RepID=A0A4Y9Y373_9APHY|nr:hypothetical protein EVJ58_g7334 [Rhodofomes roseus]
MDNFELAFNLESFLTSEGQHAPEDTRPAGGVPVDFDHKPDGYPGYCVIA